MPVSAIYAEGAECVRQQMDESNALRRVLLRCMVEYYSYKLVPSLAHNLRKHNALPRPSSLGPGPYPRLLTVKRAAHGRWGSFGTPPTHEKPCLART
jgi:hypothetical protein